MLTTRGSAALEAGRLRETAGQLRSRAQSAPEGAQRTQLVALADYYDDMAAEIEQPPPPAASAPAY